MLVAITYRTRDNSRPTYTVFNPMVDENEVVRLRKLPSTIYNPVDQTMIVTF